MRESYAQDFLVERRHLDKTRWASSRTQRDQPLAQGEALLKVIRYALTSNNITYALLGEMARYWEFFPAEPGWGRIPAWGFADVVASSVTELREGQRVFGYLPMSSLLKVQPVQVTERGFVDGTGHRRSLPAIYQQYTKTPALDALEESLRSLLQPLIMTGALIDQSLHDAELYGARQILLGSASSKTALAAAFMLARRAGRGYQVIGLTSARHRDFCARVGVYDRVVDYEALRSLPADVPSAFVDMSGAPQVRREVHEHFRDALHHSSVVGLTHGLLAPPAPLPGPAPQVFSAPAIVEKVRQDLGAAALDARLNEAQTAFLTAAHTWLEPQEVAGAAAIEAAYQRVRTGQVKPQHGIIVLA